METLAPSPAPNEEDPTPKGETSEDSSYIDWVEGKFDSNDAPQEDDEPFQHPEAYSEVGGTGIEVDKREEAALLEREKEEVESSLILTKSRKLRGNILKAADKTVQLGEVASSTTGDATHNAKNWYKKRQIKSTEAKLARYNRRAETAVFDFRRRKFARKARMQTSRLNRLSRIYSAFEDKHNKLAFGVEAEKSEDSVKSIREQRREARSKTAESRTESLIAKEYKFAKIAKEQRRKNLRELGTRTLSPERKEELKRLLSESSTARGLEKAGKDILLTGIAKSNLSNSVKRFATIAVNEFADAMVDYQRKPK